MMNVVIVSVIIMSVIMVNVVIVSIVAPCPWQAFPIKSNVSL
jgi:hypothetical protein